MPVEGGASPLILVIGEPDGDKVWDVGPEQNIGVLPVP